MDFFSSLSQIDKILMVAGLAAIIAISSLMIWAITFSKIILKIQKHQATMKGFDYLLIFILFLAIGILTMSFILYGTHHWGASFNSLMFGAFPYVCLMVFLVGAVYRYRKSGFQVSSLSSQFLEGKKLFWGSQLFHWGILFLFFGHLIAFLLPKSVIAWNGNPVRLVILEASAFAFGISALLGLVLFIYRRLSTKRVLMVTNKMDMLVYVVLIMQIFSGLGVAFYVRWGSSWFASVLTPYLLSVFTFNPRVDLMSNMPWLVQAHVISAFLIVGIIPFTRFMHFLVAPLDYIWRSYQIVIWNWNHKSIRRQKTYFPGKRSTNN